MRLTWYPLLPNRELVIFCSLSLMTVGREKRSNNLSQMQHNWFTYLPALQISRSKSLEMLCGNLATKSCSMVNFRRGCLFLSTDLAQPPQTIKQRGAIITANLILNVVDEKIKSHWLILVNDKQRHETNSCTFSRGIMVFKNEYTYTLIYTCIFFFFFVILQ